MNTIIFLLIAMRNYDSKRKPAAVIHAMSFLHGTKSPSVLVALLGQVEHAFCQNKGEKALHKTPNNRCCGLVERCNSER